MTKIWVDTTILRGSETCGMAEYTKNLIGILEKNSYKMECFYNPFLSFGFLSTKIYFLWLNTFFLLKTVIYKPDIIIFPSYIMPFFIRKKTRYYVVFYDIMLSREEYFGEKSTKTFKLYLYIAAKKATKIITISNTTKKLLNDEFKIPLENISIIN